MENLELKLLEEINKLQQYAIKTPLDSKNFWKDWQAVFTKVKLGQIAIKTLLTGENLKAEDKKLLNKKLQLFKELETYLRELKSVALSVKGYTLFSAEESEEGNDDLDDLLF